jgi:hypothetical protein
VSEPSAHTQRATEREAPPAMPASVEPARRRPRRESRVWRRTTMRRALIEGVGIFVAGRLLAMAPPEVWPALIFPLLLILRLALMFGAPVWAAMRVVSTRREKMSRRFWKLGPVLAAYCVLADTIIALALGDALIFGGPAGPPDLLRFGLRGDLALAPLDFAVGEVVKLALLALYFTIAVVCTRLANGGFMRFTMPAGDGRVTL